MTFHFIINSDKMAEIQGCSNDGFGPKMPCPVAIKLALCMHIYFNEIWSTDAITNHQLPTCI